jgi:hypothetical protein
VVWVDCEGVAESQAYGGVHGQRRDRGRITPAGGVSLDPVRAGLYVVGAGGDSVEAQGELLVDAAVGVDQDVVGVAVDAGQRPELDRDS